MQWARCTIGVVSATLVGRWQCQPGAGLDVTAQPQISAILFLVACKGVPLAALAALEGVTEAARAFQLFTESLHIA